MPRPYSWHPPLQEQSNKLPPVTGASFLSSIACIVAYSLQNIAKRPYLSLARSLNAFRGDCCPALGTKEFFFIYVRLITM